MRKLLALSSVVGLLTLGATNTAQTRTEYTKNSRVICAVFGKYCSQALRVAWCESRYDVWATNGQYWGLFQMGSSERAKYGHAWNAWAESRAAYRYFKDTHYTWGPWQECKPW